jgi:hypothetical protein
VRGPEFARRIRDATTIVERAEKSAWDFAATPELYAADSMADVIAKEIAIVHNGSYQTIIGNLITAGVGTHFNLMGPIQSDAKFMIKPNTLLADLARQMRGQQIQDFDLTRKYGTPLEIDFYNYTNFFTLKDLVFWQLVHGSGCFPTALEFMKRHFAAGKIVQNNSYTVPSFVAQDSKQPAGMSVRCMRLSHATDVVEWMDKPLFGGLEPDTAHVEYLLTPLRSQASHPYLPLVDEGLIEYAGIRWHAKKFAGVTPKEGLRGPDVGSEAKSP